MKDKKNDETRIVEVDERSSLPIRLFLIGKIIGLSVERAKQLNKELTEALTPNDELPNSRPVDGLVKP